MLSNFNPNIPRNHQDRKTGFSFPAPSARYASAQIVRSKTKQKHSQTLWRGTLQLAVEVVFQLSLIFSRYGLLGSLASPKISADPRRLLVKAANQGKGTARNGAEITDCLDHYACNMK